MKYADNETMSNCIHFAVCQLTAFEHVRPIKSVSERESRATRDDGSEHFQTVEASERMHTASHHNE